MRVNGLYDDTDTEDDGGQDEGGFTANALVDGPDEEACCEGAEALEGDR